MLQFTFIFRKSFQVPGHILRWSIVLLLFIMGLRASAATFPVLNGNNAGAGSLRQAISDANAAGAGPHTISFTVSGTITITTSLPALTVPNVTIDGGNSVTISGPGGDNTVALFILNAGANNTTITRLTLQNTGLQPITINGALSGVRLEDLRLRQTGVDYANYGIYVGAAANNMTIRNVTITDIQKGTCWAIRFRGTVNGLTVEGLRIYNSGPNHVGAGNDIRGIQFEAAATNIDMRNSTIDLNAPGSTDDGNYGIYFNTTVNGFIFDSCQVRDGEVYSLFLGGAASNININNAVFSNKDGWVSNQLVRFNNAASNVTIAASLFDGDLINTGDDSNDGLLFMNNMQAVTIRNNTFRDIDINALYSAGLNNDNIQVRENLFERIGSGTEVQGAMQFVGIHNTTSDGGQVRIVKNTMRDINGVGVFLRPGNGGSYVIPNLLIDSNTITGTKSIYGGIRINYVDKIVISRNSIYNNVGKAIELNDATAANCGYEGVNTPQMLSSVETSAGSGIYNISVKMPAICGTGNCSLELFATEAGMKGIGGQHYVGTYTGLGSGLRTLTGVTGPFAEITGAPYGVWTSTLRLTNNCGTSEFSNKIAIQVNGPAGVNAGVQLWLNPDYTDPGNMINGVGWEDFSGNNRHFGMVFSDPARVNAGLNFNHYINFDGNDYLRSAASPFVSSYTAGEAITVTKTPTTNTNTGNPYDFGSGSRSSHYTYGNAAVYNGFGTSDRFGWNPLTKAILDGKAGINAASIIGTPIDVRKWNIYGTRSGANNWGIDFNGGQQTISSANNVAKFTLAAGNEYVGAMSGTVFLGDIAEQALYNRVLTALERQRINSYFAVKYGLTLYQDYVASNGTTTWWSLAANAGFNKGIAGVAKDVLSVLHQKQSRSLSADDVVTIGVGSYLYSANEDNDADIKNDRSAFMWGTDSASTAYVTPYITAYSDARMTRRWKVQKTNWFDTTIIIKLKGGNPNRMLLVSTDPGFASGVTNYPLNDTGAVILNSGVFANGAYFTFSNKLSAPGCVTNGIQAWYRADDANAAPAAWTDFSGLDRTAAQATAANQPLLANSSINFNPAFNLDGSNDYLNIPHNLGISGTNPFTLISVTKRESLNTVDMILGQQSDATNTFSNYFTSGKYATGPINVGSIVSTGTYSVANIPYMNATTRSGNLFNLYTNGAADGSGTQPYNFLTINQRIGWRGGATVDFFDGHISEIVVYNRSLSAGELLQVNSYLALKYGITLNNGTSDYVATNGTTKMWDAAVNAGYNKDIAGIGKDSCDRLHQKQSRSVNTGAPVTMALGDVVAADNRSNTNTVTNNLSFLTWGDNGGVITYTVNASGENVTLRMGRVWKVDKTNWPDHDITIKLNGSARNTFLLISNSDASFATIDQELALGDDSTVTINSNLLPDGAYFTFGKQILGPGYVNSSVVTWQRADDGISRADAWYDFSGNGNDAAQTVVADQPGVISGANDTAINFNPGYLFKTTAEWFDYNSDITLSGTGNKTVIWAARSLAATGGSQAILSHSATGTNLFVAFHDNANRPLIAVGGGGSTCQPVSPSTMSFGTSLIGTFNRSSATSATIFTNGGFPATSTCNSNFVGQNMRIGARNSAANPFNGNISEVIVYNRSLTTLELQRVHSYLALKYGISLDQSTPTDYVATDWDGANGTKSWTAAKNTGYGFRIAGIGRDDLTKLYQKQSRSADANALISIGAGTMLAADNASNASEIDNLSFFTWSDNNLGDIYTIPVAGVANATMRMPRVWKVDRTNWSDQDITIQTDKNGARYVLVNATDPSFGAGTAEYAINTATGSVTINTTNLPDGAYFTLATKIVGPGCVNNNIRMWLRGDYNSTPSNWADFSGNQYNVTQATAANQPTWLSNGVNFNPALNLDGTNDFLRNATRLYAATSGFELIAVSADKRTSFAELRGQMGIGVDGNYPGMDFQTDATSPNGVNFWMTTSTPAEWNGGTLPNVNGKTNISMLSSTNLTTAAVDNIRAGINGISQMTNLDAKQQAQIGNGVFVGNSGDAYWKGYIPEIIIYDRELTPTEEQKVHSYLALKYGVTLNNGTVDYVASDWDGINGTKMWTAADNTGYNFRITGIGRDDCDELYQKQSRNQDGGMVTVAIGSMVAAANAENTDSIAGNNSYFVFADNNLDTTYSVPLSVSGITPTVRMPRVWKVDKTNWTGADITLKYNRNVSRVYLLISTDANFASGVEELALIVDDSTVTFSSDMLPDGVYFTFAREVYGPGYVNNGIQVWLRADDGSSAIDNWLDYSGNENHATQATAASQPAAVASAINYNPGFDFDGSADYLDIAAGLGISGTNPFTVVGLGMRQSVATWDVFLAQPNGNTNDLFFGYTPGNVIGLGATGVSTSVGTTAYATANVPQFVAATRSGNTFSFYANGRADGIATAAYNFNTDNTRVGNRLASADLAYDGYMGEVIVYNRVLDNTELLKVNAYLALKYGITLDNGNTNYVATDWDGSIGTVYWTTDATYKNNIAGIGRDDKTGLLQKQSRSIITAGNGNMVAMGLGSIEATNLANTGSFTDDLSFMVWGDNGLNGNKNTEYPAALGANGCSKVTRLQREWKVQETGAVGFVQVQFYLAGLVPNSTTIADLSMLVDDDGDFANGTTTVVTPAAYDAATQTVTFNDINFTDGQYFTLVTDVTNQAPGGVITNLYTWFRADKGVTTTTGVSLWSDQSASLEDVAQATAANQPVFNTAASLINFNPSMSFNGSTNVLINSAIGHTATPNGEDIFAVVLPNNATGVQTAVGLGTFVSTANTTELRFNTGRLEYISNSGANSTITYATASNGLVQIANAHRAATGAGNAFLLMNGLQVATGTVSATPALTQLNIGSRRLSNANNQFFNGRVAEVAIYNRQLTAPEREKVASYLAIKYGITVPHNYVYPNGTVVWDQSQHTGYSSNITAIGRDDCNGLHQKQSKSMNAGAMVTIGAGIAIESFNTANLNTLEDNTAIVFGDNNGNAAAWTATEAPGGRKRITREWKVQVTGTAGITTIQVPAATSPATVKLPAEINRIYMLVDADGDFASGAEEVQMVLNGDNWEAAYEFTGNVYFTFATGNDFLTLNAKAILQGAWNGIAMRTDLKSAGVLPATDPYGSNTTPSVNPNATVAPVVDWVRVELRDATDPSVVVAARAGFLLSNGDVVDTGYVQPIAMYGLDAGEYFVVIKHRNHLGVMSMNALDFGTGFATIDFTSTATATYGSYAQSALSGGFMGLWAGDVNGDHSVRHSAKPSDASAVAHGVMSHAGNTASDPAYTGFSNVYNALDVNLDGRVYLNASPPDRNIIVSNVLMHPANVFGIAAFIIKEQLP